jgi:quercetin dioxygenase-like cupin family protein
MDNPEYKNSEAFKIIDMVEYLPKSVVIKSILRKTTGSVTAVSFDSGEILVGKKSPFDTLIQIIEGKSEIIIDDKSNLLRSGESIIIPAHTSNLVKANVRFKMISTIIKSGYEEMVL